MSAHGTLDTVVQNQAALLEHLHYAVLATNAEGRVVYWNRFATQLFQWEAREMIGQSTTRLFPGDAPCDGATLSERSHQEGPLEVETTFQRKDGSRFLGRNVSTRVRGPDGKILGQITVTTDVREPRTGKRGTPHGDAPFRSLAEDAPLLIWMTDAAGELTYVNQRLASMTGLSTGEVLGERWIDAIHPEDEPAAVDAYSKAIAERRELRHEFRVHDQRRGTYLWVLWSAAPHFAGQL